MAAVLASSLRLGEQGPELIGRQLSENQLRVQFWTIVSRVLCFYLALKAECKTTHGQSLKALRLDRGDSNCQQPGDDLAH